VNLVEVDVIDAERLQAPVHPASQPFGAGVAGALVVVAQPALGRDHDLVAAVVEVVAQRLAEQPLREAEPICLRRIEEVDPEIARVTDRRHHLALVELPPLPSDLPRAEGDPGDLELGHSESRCVHVKPPLIG
jgi:hypothetical protein